MTVRVRKEIEERGAISCYWDYAPSFGNGPFRNVTCLSVNDAAQHGLPHDRPARQPHRRHLRGAKTTSRIRMDPDDWTVRSADGSRASHTEHTLAITPDGPLVLTA